MGHGIFPNYGLSYQKTIFCHLSPSEKKAVFFPDKKARKVFNKFKDEEEDSKDKRKKK